MVGVAALNTIDKRMYRYWVMKGRRKLEKNFSSCGTFVVCGNCDCHVISSTLCYSHRRPGVSVLLAL